MIVQKLMGSMHDKVLQLACIYAHYGGYLALGHWLKNS